MTGTTKDFIGIEKVIKENKLIIKTKILQESNLLSWKIKIVYDSSVLYETGFSRDKSVVFQLKETGKYLIFYQAKLDSKVLLHERESIWYYTQAEFDKYKQFYNNYTCSEEKLKLWGLEYPYQNMALLSYDECYTKISELHDNINEIGEGLSLFKLSKINNIHNEVIASLDPIIDSDGISFFSGKGIDDEKLILGQEDLKDVDSKAETFKNVGYYSVVYQNMSGIAMTNDYYGMYPLYTYMSKKVNIVCNSFHMLIIILRILGEKITLNVENILPYFVCGQRMMFEQLVNHESFIKEIRKLEVHKMYTVNLSGVNLVDKEIANVLKRKKEYDVKEYSALLEKAAEETIHNIEIILKDSRFKKVTCDVTGGKDSRTVLAALLNCCNGYEEKVVINSRDLPYTQDKNIFIPLNNLHRLKYNSGRNVVEHINIKKVIDQNRSATMGVCFSRGIPYEYKGGELQKSEIKLLGAGEQILRTTFSSYFNCVDYSNSQTIATSIAKYYNNGEVNFENISDELIRELSKGLSEVLGQDMYEIFNNHCLYFRNVYHFGLEAMLDSINNNFEIWSPLYTKTAGKIWHTVCSEFKNMRFQVEMIDKLCPILLKIPFESAHDQKEFENIQKSENNLDKRFRNIHIDYNYDDVEWRTANNSVLENRVVTNKEYEVEIDLDNKKFFSSYYQIIMNRLNKVLHYDSRFKESIGMDLFLLLEKNKDLFGKNMPKNIVFMCNKITAVSDIIDLLMKEEP